MGNEQVIKKTGLSINRVGKRNSARSWKVGSAGEGSTALDKAVKAGLFEKALSESRPERPAASQATLRLSSKGSG